MTTRSRVNKGAPDQDAQRPTKAAAMISFDFTPPP